jgi:nitrogen fixation protein NifB
MMPRTCTTGRSNTYPCFCGFRDAGWVRLPVATACNIECRFCSRTFDHPETASGERKNTLLGPDEAVDRVRRLVAGKRQVKGVVISGPGESLANAATYVVLRKINWEFPDIPLAISTNGLLLRDRVEQIIADGVRTVAVTMNAFSSETARKVYSRILYKGRRYLIDDSAEFLLKNQWQGLMLAVEAGLSVVVNSVVIPGVNENDIPLIAEQAGKLKADLMRTLPFSLDEGCPDRAHPGQSIATIRDRCRPFIPQAC